MRTLREHSDYFANIMERSFLNVLETSNNIKNIIIYIFNIIGMLLLNDF